MGKTTINIQIPIRNPSKRKKKRLESVMKKQGEIAEKIAELMPSLPKYRWSGTKADSVFHRWVGKLYPDNNGLRSHDANQVSYKVAENFGTHKTKGYPGEKPSYDSEEQDWARFCNCGNQVKYECNHGKWGVRLPLEPRNPEWFRLKVGEYQEHYFKKVREDDDARFGTAEIKKKGPSYMLNQSITFSRPEKVEDPEVKIGVDLGLKNIAVAVGLDRDGEFLGGPFSNNSPFYSGDEVRHYRDKMEKVRQRLQEAGESLDRVNSLKLRYPRQVNHTVSRRIVDFASGFDSAVIKFEDLEGIREDVNSGDPGKYHKRRLNSWAFSELQNFTRYKAEMDGVDVLEVNPKNTSRMCPKCGCVSADNRSGVDFVCVECGYENHADFVGAWNIAVSTDL